MLRLGCGIILILIFLLTLLGLFASPEEPHPQITNTAFLIISICIFALPGLALICFGWRSRNEQKRRTEAERLAKDVERRREIDRKEIIAKRNKELEAEKRYAQIIKRQSLDRDWHNILGNLSITAPIAEYDDSAKGGDWSYVKTYNELSSIVDRILSFNARGDLHSASESSECLRLNIEHGVTSQVETYYRTGESEWQLHCQYYSD